MSDPVTNAEVEDVLSSIRRLVSEEKRPLQSAKSSPLRDRLVLTPALRVADEMVDAPRPNPVLQGSRDAAGVPDAEVTEAIAQGDRLQDAAPQDHLTVDDAEPLVLDAATPSRAAAPATQDSSCGDDMPIGTPTAQQPPLAEPERQHTGATLGAKIEALETAIGKIADRWEPDSADGDDYSGTEPPAMIWEDDVHRDATGAPLDQADQAGPAETDGPDDGPIAQDSAVGDDTGATAAAPFALAGEDQVLDEEALRDLVSEIVREELQGALGERITRNVRKLVRREIHRALTAQELE